VVDWINLFPILRCLQYGKPFILVSFYIYLEYIVASLLDYTSFVRALI